MLLSLSAFAAGAAAAPFDVDASDTANPDQISSVLLPVTHSFGDSSVTRSYDAAKNQVVFDIDTSLPCNYPDEGFANVYIDSDNDGTVDFQIENTVCTATETGLWEYDDGWTSVWAEPKDGSLAQLENTYGIEVDTQEMVIKIPVEGFPYSTGDTFKYSIHTSNQDDTHNYGSGDATWDKENSSGFSTVHAEPAGDGDTITVHDGTYEPFGTSFSGPHDLTVTAADGATPVIESTISFNDGPRRLVDLRANGTTLSGFEIVGNGDTPVSGGYVGVSVSGADARVENNVIGDALTGVQTTTHFGTGDATIFDNTIDADYGISLQNDGNNVTDNDVTAEVEGLGLITTGTTFSGNTLSVSNGPEAKVYGGSIQAGIDAVSAGDTVEVNSGTYEDFIVNKDVSVVGIGDPVIDSSQVDITADGAELHDFTFTGDYSDWTGDDRFRPAHVQSPAGSVYYPILWVNADDVTVGGVEMTVEDNSDLSGAVTGVVVSGDSELVRSNLSFPEPPNDVDLNQNIFEFTEGSNVVVEDNSFSRFIGGIVGENQHVTVRGNEFTGEALQNFGFNGPSWGPVPSSATLDVGNNGMAYVMPDQSLSGPSGGGFYASASIQSVVDKTATGGTVHVDPGVYNESVTISTDNLTLESTDGPAKTTIQAQAGDENVVTVEPGTDNTAIRGFTITGGERRGISVGAFSGFDGVTIEDNHIVDNGLSASAETHGILADDGSNVVIRDNVIEDLAADESENRASGISIVAQSVQVTDILVEDNTIRNVTTLDTGIGKVNGIELSHSVEGAIVRNNTIEGLTADKASGIRTIEVNGTHGPNGFAFVENDISGLEGDTDENALAFGGYSNLGNYDISDNNFRDGMVAYYLQPPEESNLNITKMIAENTFDRAVTLESSGLFAPYIWNSVQDVVDVAKENDTIHVNPGTYGSVTVDTENVTLLGEDRQSVIEGQLAIEADGVTVDGFGFLGTDAVPEDSGGFTNTVIVGNVNDFVLENSDLDGQDKVTRAVHLTTIDSGPITLENVTIGDYFLGVNGYGDDVTVEDSSIIDIEEGGINLQQGDNLRVIDSNISVGDGHEGNRYAVRFGYTAGEGDPRDTDLTIRDSILNVEIGDPGEGDRHAGVILRSSSTGDLRVSHSQVSGLASDTETQVDARRNYWGHPSGPERQAGNATVGKGEQVSGDVTYTPWYPTTAMTAGATGKTVESGKPATLSVGSGDDEDDDSPDDGDDGGEEDRVNITVKINASGNASATAEQVTTPPQNASPPQNRGAFGGGVNVTVTDSNGTVNASGTVTIRYSESFADSVEDEESISIYYYNETVPEWQEVPDTQVFPGNNTVQVPVSHFSMYAAYGQPDQGGTRSGERADISVSEGGGGGGGAPSDDGTDETDEPDQDTDTTPDDTGEDDDTGEEPDDAGEQTPEEPGETGDGPSAAPDPTGFIGGAQAGGIAIVLLLLAVAALQYTGRVDVRTWIPAR